MCSFVASWALAAVVLSGTSTPTNHPIITAVRDMLTDSESPVRRTAVEALGIFAEKGDQPTINAVLGMAARAAIAASCREWLDWKKTDPDPSVVATAEKCEASFDERVGNTIRILSERGFHSAEEIANVDHEAWVKMNLPSSLHGCMVRSLSYVVSSSGPERAIQHKSSAWWSC